MVTLEQCGVSPDGTTCFIVTGPYSDSSIAELKGCIDNVTPPSNPTVASGDLQYDVVYNASWGMVAPYNSIVVRDKMSDAWLRVGQGDLVNASDWLKDVIGTEICREMNRVRAGGEVVTVQ